MKVLHISGAGSWGGNEQQLADLIPELEKLGVQNAVMGVSEAPLHHYCKENSISFIEAKDAKLNTFKNYRFLKEIIKNTKTDVIHLHSSNSVTLYTISDLFYSLKTPTVFSKKGMGSSMSFLSLYKYNYKNLNKIICVSEAVKTFMRKDVIKPKNHSKLVTIYDGINTNRLVPIRTENIKVLFKISEDKKIIGNIANQFNAKDLPTLIQMMHHLVYTLNYTNVHLLQIGKFTNLTDGLKQQIVDLKLDEYVTFAGFQEHATDLMAQFDVYVMSSEREGLPLTIYEAFYKKIPVVSTKAGGIPEVITDGENGFLAEIKDFETLAEKTKILLEDESLQKKFEESSFDMFQQKFNANKTAEQTLALYKSML